MLERIVTLQLKKLARLAVTGAAAFFLYACNQSPQQGNGQEQQNNPTPLAECIDKDGDGYGSNYPTRCKYEGIDCNDSDHTIYPGAREVCDYQDNDCDGSVDEMVTKPLYIDHDGDGFGNCKELVHTCSEMDTDPKGIVHYADNCADCNDGDPSINPEAEELCDGIDNNCNNFIDEDREVACGCNGRGTAREVCRDGSYVLEMCIEDAECCPGDERYTAPCACDGLAGRTLERCIDGSYAAVECVDVPECCPGDQRIIEDEVCVEDSIAGNPLEACVDFRYEYICCEREFCPGEEADVVFLIDRSGSMSDDIAAVIDSLYNFVERFEDERYRFALIDIPQSGRDGTFGLTLNFRSYEDFIDTLGGAWAGGGSLEATYDAVYDALLPGNPLGLGYRADAIKYMVLFTDEPGQSYTHVPALTESDVRGMVQGRDARFYGFMPPGVQPAFDDIVRDAGDDSAYGRIFDLSADSEVMADRMEEMFTDIEKCFRSCADES